MATGLAVDYSVYFSQKFMATAGPSRDARVAHALTDTGAAIFLGGLTALSGAVPLAFATSTILRTFFDLLFGTILFALLVGLVFLPVSGPPSHHHLYASLGPTRVLLKCSLDQQGVGFLSFCICSCLLEPLLGLPRACPVEACLWTIRCN